MLLLALRGNAFLYQGEELGLPTAAVPFDRLQDPDAILNWPVTLGRDGARTPMPWIGGAPMRAFRPSRRRANRGCRSIPNTMSLPSIVRIATPNRRSPSPGRRSEENTSELQTLMRISYAVF